MSRARHSERSRCKPKEAARRAKSRSSSNSGDAVIAGAEHPLKLVETEHGPSPRIAVRHGLEAELSRAIYYELAEIALSEGHDPPGIWGGGRFFPLAPMPSE